MKLVRRTTTVSIASMTWLILVVGIVSHCAGQGLTSQGRSDRRGGPSTSPYQQRLSPYLDLLRTDNSTLGPYHSFVRPRQQFQQSINQQAAQLRQLKQSTVGRTTMQPAQNRLQTGRGGTFNNHLHFYQSRSGRSPSP